MPHSIATHAFRTVWLVIIGVGMMCGASTAAADRPDKSVGMEFFESKIRPVLVENCYQCHSAKSRKVKGKLLLDTRAGIRKGGITGPAVSPGEPDKSLILKALRHEDDLAMPPDRKLPDSVVADFAKWIALGAPDPREGKIVTTSDIDWVDGRQFWAFQPPRQGKIPNVKNPGWVKTPIDAFILAKLEEQSLSPVPTAGRRELIRRATFDLIGLPPTPEEVEAFLTDHSPSAFAKVVNRLLDSPHYGERWGRIWLDVARYAEDQAHTFAVVPNTSAWRYRDWVIASLNSDMPYDRFVKLQIAADLIEKDEASQMQHLPALGFFGLGAQYYKNTDAAKAAADELDDRVDTMTRAFLGLTVSCARCHDHKFDPIPQQDYYSLAGVFSSCRLTNLPLASKEKQKRFQEAQDKAKKLDGEIKSILREERQNLALAQAGDASRYLLSAWKHQVRKQKGAKSSLKDLASADRLDPAILERTVKLLQKSSPALAGFKSLNAAEAEMQSLAAKVQQQINEIVPQRGKGLDRAKAELLQALFLADNAVFAVADAQAQAKLAGDRKKRHAALTAEMAQLQKSEAMKPLPLAHGLAEAKAANMKVFLRGNPAKLGDEAPRRFLKILAGDDPKPFSQGSGRLELANAIASRENPLTARVIVNRVWQNHFGRGLVGTPSNFGKLGERPTHPELLDYLAVRFMETGWSLKSLHRDIMLSAVYQLGSGRDDSNLTRDADNRWLWRMNRRRLDIESWRDAMLAVSGKLDARLGGPTVDLSAGANNRRTVYAKVSRHDLNHLLRLFDFPDANITSEKRTETTVPQQQLFVLNSPFVIEQSRALAARLAKDAATDELRVRRAFLLAYGRPARETESRLALDFLAGKDDPAEQSQNRLTRWERFAQVLLGSNEFMYID